jgi:Tfp pilus assembly protein PilE
MLTRMAAVARSARGFTVMELLIVVAFIGVLCAIAIPLYVSIQSRARIAKAHADVRTLASATSIYGAHCSGYPDNGSSATNCPIATGQTGDLPVALTLPQTNTLNQVAGPFISTAPQLPGGWTGSGTSYKYTTPTTDTFLICASGDGTAADSNGGTTCP